MIENKVVLVTGVSSGIGRETARMLAERGARLFGTIRDHRSDLGASGVELIRMDVTSDASVTEAVQSVLRSAGEIDALVNNAGYALLGGLEETSLSEAERQFDTNFFGALRVTQAVLPSMRRLGKGRIVNISSIVGLLPTPYMGIYAASKHALEGYTETLDHEVRTLGIRTVLVEPGFMKTNLERNGQTALCTLEAYAGQRKRVVEAIRQEIASGNEPRVVAEAVLHALTVEWPRLRYPVGKSAMLSRFRRFVPTRLFDPNLRKYFRLDEPIRR
jgi:NAD(P)-dependent dehydrogenase (short-subunit alcohol dehydrogenase family)